MDSALPWLKPLLTAILGAVVYAVEGYFKSKPEEEIFDPQKFATTVVIGIAVGIAMFHWQLPFDLAHQLLLSIGVIVLIENGVKAIWRHFRSTRRRQPSIPPPWKT